MPHAPALPDRFSIEETAPADSRSHIRFILSRGAGKGMDRSGAANELIMEILRVYPQATHSTVGMSAEECGDVTISLTYSEHDVYDLAHEWDEMWGSSGVVYIAGGDGSVNEVASALAGKACAFGVIPMGTGNDFARGLYGPKISLKLAVSLIEKTATAQFGPIDLLRADAEEESDVLDELTSSHALHHVPEGTPTYCINVFSLGYDTQVLLEALRMTERVPAVGRFAYLAAAARTGTWDKGTPLRIEATSSEGESVEVEQRCAAMIVGNNAYYGGGYNPLPEAVLDDGLADALYVDDLKFASFVHMIQKYRRGTHTKDPRAHFLRTDRIRIERTDGEDVLWNVDGVVHRSVAVEISVVPGALTLARL